MLTMKSRGLFQSLLCSLVLTCVSFLCILQSNALSIQILFQRLSQTSSAYICPAVANLSQNLHISSLLHLLPQCLHAPIRPLYLWYSLISLMPPFPFSIPISDLLSPQGFRTQPFQSHLIPLPLPPSFSSHHIDLVDVRIMKKNQQFPYRLPPGSPEIVIHLQDFFGETPHAVLCRLLWLTTGTRPLMGTL